MKVFFKNIIACLVYLWCVPFYIAMIVISYAGSLFILPFRNMLNMKKNETWKITKSFEKMIDWLNDTLTGTY